MQWVLSLRLAGVALPRSTIHSVLRCGRFAMSGVARSVRLEHTTVEIVLISALSHLVFLSVLSLLSCF